MNYATVIPAKTGTHSQLWETGGLEFGHSILQFKREWVPAFAGMTI